MERGTEEQKSAQRMVLFLCTGNYYRSRLAEEIFNNLAQDAGADWVADSAGLAEDVNKIGNPGAISTATVAYLHAMGYRKLHTERAPQSLTEAMIERADRIVVMDKNEHVPMVEARAELRDRVSEYWEIGDIGYMSVTDATQGIEALVKDLFERCLGEAKR